MKKVTWGCFVFTAVFNVAVCAQTRTAGNSQNEAVLKTRIIVGDTILTATMNDGPAARDFLSLLPLTLTLRDYAGIEKISDLPKRLSTDKAPRGIDPSVGDITYYAPWGNLALFYRDHGYESGLVLLGRLDSGIEVFSVAGSVKATFELIR